MKKLLSIILLGFIVLGLSGCAYENEARFSKLEAANEEMELAVEELQQRLLESENNNAELEIIAEANDVRFSEYTTQDETDLIREEIELAFEELFRRLSELEDTVSELIN